VVTGAAGHLGGCLIRQLLEQGCSVRALVHDDTRAIDGLPVERASADICDPVQLRKALQGADVVYHLAAVISLDPRDAPRMHQVNVEGARQVAEACLATRVGRLVHFSSIHAFSPEPRQAPVDEARPLVTTEPVPDYDRSKADGDREISRGVASGLDAVILHPVGVIGPCDFRPSHMGRVLMDLYRGRLPGMVDGGFTWVDARDVAQAALAAAERGRKGERYLLAGHRASMPEIAAMVQRYGGHRPPRLTVPLWLASAIAPVAELGARVAGVSTPFNRAAMHALSNHQVVLHDKARAELGFSPRPVAESVADALDWFRQHSRL
jgi:dihydroflavonol-4-reductase